MDYVQVVISGEHDYSSVEVQQDVERLITAMENTTYIDPDYTESWLRNGLVFYSLENLTIDYN